MIADVLKKITNNFENGFTSSTMMGWEPNYDAEGRPLNCNPNYRDGSITIEGQTYWFTRRRWEVRIWNRKADYGDFMSDKKDYIEVVDLTPNYLSNEKR